MFMRSGYSAHTRRARSATHHHHGGAEMGVRLGDPGPRLGAEAGRGALRLELGGRERGQLYRVLGRAGAAVRGDRLADPLQHDDVAAGPDGDWEGEVAPAVALPDVRGQRLGRVDLEGPQLLGEGERDEAAGGEVLARRAEEGGPRGAAREQLDRL